MNKFFISDLHLGHSNIINFTDENGKHLRPFDSLEEMHETIKDRWNSVVQKKDTVYVLGDVFFGSKWIPFFKSFKGNKILIRGNHDSLSNETLKECFGSIHAMKQVENCILTHIPVHPSCLGHRWLYNIHGHVHSHSLPDIRYINVSCETVDYTPISWENMIFNREEN